MPPKSYYEVDRRVNFFGLISAQATESGPEEKVRQWVISELLSTYGYSVSSLDVEAKVKIGSKAPVRIDVLIRKEGRPYIVVECKRLEYSKHDAGLLQAISYANADSVQAEFVVYTNGKEWQVRRRFDGEWVPVPDIERATIHEGTGSVEEMLSALNQVKPLLYWINRPLEGKYGIPYIMALQSVFHGNFWCWSVELDRKFTFGIDLLARSLIREDLDEPYAQDKLAGACSEFSKVIERLTRKPIEFMDAWGAVNYCRFGFEELLENSKGTVSYPEIMLMRIAIALLQIACDGLHGKKYVSMDREFRALGDEVSKLLEYVFCVAFDAKFDDALMLGNGYSLDILCEEAWQQECQQARGRMGVSVPKPDATSSSRKSVSWISILKVMFCRPKSGKA